MACNFDVIVDQLMAEVRRCYTEKLMLTDEVLTACQFVYLGPLLSALDLIDRRNITLLISPSGRTLFKVVGSSGTPYMCSSNVNYCECLAYRFSVLKKSEYIMCKHVLAVRLSEAMKLYKEICISDEELSSLLKYNDLSVEDVELYDYICNLMPLTSDDVTTHIEVELGGDKAPPIPARSPISRYVAPVHRPLKSPARLPRSSSGGSQTSSRDRVTERLLGDQAPPIPSRAPRGVNLSSCPPAPVLPRGSNRDGSLTTSPKKLIMIDARRNSGHSVLMQTTRGGRATILPSPERSAKTSTSSSNKGINKNLNSPVNSVSDRVVSLNHWPIRQMASTHLPIEGTPATRHRRVNEYVEGPSLTFSGDRDTSSLPEAFRPHGPGITLRDCQESDRTPSGPATSLKWSEKTGATGGAPVCQEGIVCSRCGRCRCSNCALPQELPRRWIGEYECSVQSMVDTCTCMRCVRCVLFHTRRSEEEDLSDEPCACTERPACCLRWGLIGLLAFTCLPCLLCYLPCRCAVDSCNACYNSCHSVGCRCEQSTSGQVSGTKGLLTPESESSSY